MKSTIFFLLSTLLIVASLANKLLSNTNGMVVTKAFEILQAVKQIHIRKEPHTSNVDWKSS